MSQTDMAGQLGLTPSAVGRWESTENRSSEPSGRILWMLVKLYRLNPDWLFDGQGNPQLSVPVRKDDLPEATNLLTVVWQPAALEIPTNLVAESESAMKRIAYEIEELKKSIHQVTKEGKE